MPSRQRKIIFIILCTIGIFLGAIVFSNLYNQKQSTHTERLRSDDNDTNFIVVYSDAMKDGAELVKYNQNGEILNKQELNDGRALYYFAKANNDNYIISERKNRHYIMDKKGIIKSLFGPEKYEKDRGIGSAFVKSSDKYLFFSMNVGINPDYSPKQYSNELVYSEIGSSTYHHIMLPGYFEAVVENDNKAYVLYYNGTDDSIGIYVVNLKTGKKINDFTVDNHKSENKGYYPVGQNNGSSLQIFQNRLVVLLDGNDPEIRYQPVMQIISLENGKLEKEIKISNEPFSLYDSQVYNGKLYILSNNASAIIWDDLNSQGKELKLKQDKAFITRTEAERGNVSGFQIHGKSCYILYDFVKGSPSNRIREIRGYSLETGDEEVTIPLRYRSDKEMIRFFILNN